MQQAATKASFQLAYTPTNDRFRNSQPVASRAETPGFHHGGKCLNICEFAHFVGKYRTDNSILPDLLVDMEQVSCSLHRKAMYPE